MNVAASHQLTNRSVWGSSALAQWPTRHSRQFQRQRQWIEETAAISESLGEERKFIHHANHTAVRCLGINHLVHAPDFRIDEFNGQVQRL